MPPTSFLRLGALALVLGGLTVVINDATHVAYELVFDDATSFAEVATSWVAYLHGGTHFLFGVLLMFGITGVMAARADQLGAWGMAAGAFAFVGLAAMVALYATLTLATASLAPVVDPAVLEEVPPPLGPLSGIGILVYTASIALFGLVLAWRDVLSRPAGIVIAIGMPAFLFAPIPGGPEALVGLAFAWLGRQLWRTADAAPAPSPTPLAIPT